MFDLGSTQTLLGQPQAVDTERDWRGVSFSELNYYYYDHYYYEDIVKAYLDI